MDLKKLTFKEVCEIFDKHNLENNITRQYEDKNRLTAVAVIDACHFREEVSLERRSFAFTSDNKYFIGAMGGNSIFATALDESLTIRLDYCDWKVEYCYLLEE